MEQSPKNIQFPGSRWIAILSLLLTSLSTILASPRWHQGLFAWLAPLFALYFFRIGPLRRKWLWFFPLMVLTTMVATHEVIPFPTVVLLVLSIFSSIRLTLVLLLDKWVSTRVEGLLGTLFFPCISVTVEFLMSKAGGGVWSSTANSQYPFSWFIQLVSVTGVWGISFMIYWFASVAIWAVIRQLGAYPWKGPVKVYGAVLLVILIYGAIRYEFQGSGSKNPVLVGGVSCPQIPFMEQIYSDYYGQTVQIDERTSVSSPVIEKVRKAELPFIETADSLRFRKAFRAMHEVNDSLFALSQLAADRGAKVILWSEGNGLVFAGEDSLVTARGKVFAMKNRVFLLMALAVIHNGPIRPETKFLENKAVLIDPAGKILNIFHKNNPVPMAEASTPGDGLIPVITTPYGRISTSICYDADFPDQMRQLGKNKTQILLLPSGDWYAISPYHTYMALLRGIENGCSVVRQVSGGLSVAADDRGRMYVSQDYFQQGPKIWTAEVPAVYEPTIYSVIGDALAYACALMTIFFLVSLCLAGRNKGTRSSGIRRKK